MKTNLCEILIDILILVLQKYLVKKHFDYNGIYGFDIIEVIFSKLAQDMAI